MTTRNQRRYIASCLESVLSQQVDADLEILVGDDCSDDGTTDIVADIAAAHPGLLSHIRHSPRAGGSLNTQILLARASGDYIARLDGDDYWLDDKLAVQLDFLAQNLDCVAVYTNAHTVNENDVPVGLFNDVGDNRFSLAGLLRRGNFLNNSSVLLRGELKNDWLNLRGPLIDYRVHLLHARKGLLGHIGKPLVVYRISTAGSLVTYDNDNIRRLYWEAILSVPRNLVSDQAFASGIADFYRRVLFRSVRTRRPELARAWWPQVLQASPYGRFRTAWVILKAFSRSVGKELLGSFSTGADGLRPRVLYWR